MRWTTLEVLEVVRDTLTEGKRAGAADFFIGGDLNIELKLDIADDEYQGLDSIGMGCTDLSGKVALRTLLLKN